MRSFPVFSLFVFYSLICLVSCRPPVIAFWYGWYGTPEVDGSFVHWNHQILPHWRPEIAALHPSGRFSPPLDPGSTFFPARGLYSSNDPAALQAQMREIAASHIDVIAFGWHAETPGRGDGEGVGTDHAVQATLDAALSSGVRVCFHLEPYENRSIATLREDLTVLIGKYGQHEAFYRNEQGKPIFFIYDSYHISAIEWAALLTPDGPNSLRGSPLDGLFIGLLLDSSHVDSLSFGGFDGGYSYFASDGFTEAATANNWPALSRRLGERGLFFVPSIGPGYDDTRIRPWNAQNKQSRDAGRYYDRMFSAALALSPSPPFFTLTSFNEWGEGTQIEPARPFVTPSHQALADYQKEVDPESPNAAWFSALPGTPPSSDYYLRRTAYWIGKLTEKHDKVDL